MLRPRSLLWFARFEARLAWRDFFSMMMAGTRRRRFKVVIGLIALPLFLHGFALLILGFVARPIGPDLPSLIMMTATLILSGSVMLAQGIESVTRGFYARSDLELILSAPINASKLFAVRIAALAVPSAFLSILIMGPFVNVLAWRSGPQWLSAYGVILAASLTAIALAVIVTVFLFRLVGPRRTRLIAQIAAAIIGGFFIIGLQVAAMLSMGTMSRFAFLRSPIVLGHAPRLSSPIWLPARAAMGDWPSLIIVLAASLGLFTVVTLAYAPRFADYAIAASGASEPGRRTKGEGWIFRVLSPKPTLRLKERRSILRDPWLLSQTLMQLLYLLPPAVLLWRGLGRGAASIVLVPVLIMTAGQLAGGLAWLTISGEDAPDLVLSAPIAPAALLRAKAEAVLELVAVVILPFAVVLASVSMRQALAVAIAGAAAAVSTTSIQLWFRSQAKRSFFRRRHTSSRLATLAEAVVSLTWAGAGAAALVSMAPAAVAAGFALILLLVIRAISPAPKMWHRA